jgi:transposase
VPTSGLKAPLELEAAITRHDLRAYFEQMHAPALAPGDIVVMDNFGSHKINGVRDAIKGMRRAAAPLAAYYPSLNPIALAFSKFRRPLRSVTARTVGALRDSMDSLSTAATSPNAPPTSVNAVLPTLGSIGLTAQTPTTCEDGQLEENIEVGTARRARCTSGWGYRAPQAC